MVRVKICGITNIEDALVAIDAGADALGFVFAESPRKVDVSTVLDIVKGLPPFITKVGVFANQDASDIVYLMDEACLDLAQIHGDVGDKLVLGNGLGCRRLIRGVRLRSADDLHDAEHDCPQCGCAGILIDAHVEGMMGGTGKTCDWALATQAHSLNKPIILAGGLTPENVGEAVKQVRPYAVDVSSGVEASPGRKDHRKIQEFIRNAKEHA